MKPKPLDASASSCQQSGQQSNIVDKQKRQFVEEDEGGRRGQGLCLLFQFLFDRNCGIKRLSVDMDESLVVWFVTRKHFTLAS